MVENRLQAVKNRLRGYGNYLIAIIAVLLSVSLVRNITNTKESLKRIDRKAKEAAELERKNDELRKTLEMVQGGEFIEKQIRDQLGLAKEGEIVLVLPEDDVLKSLVPKLPEEEEELPDPIWRRWVQLFF